jgi:long-chain acyl-CoA synthetase
MSVWPDGLPRTLTYPEVTVGQLCTSAARLYGDRTAVVDGDETVSFTALHERACAFAQALRADGVGAGDVVVLHLANSLWFLVTYYGALLAGATVSMANPLQPVGGLRAQLADTGAVVAVTQQAGLLAQAGQGSAVRRIVVTPPTACAPAGTAGPVAAPAAIEFGKFVDGMPTVPPAIAVTGADVAHLAYTGGTTGVSKGVRVLHRNVIANVTQMTTWRASHLPVADAAGTLTLVPAVGAEDPGLRPGSATTIVVSPLFHAHALINASFMVLCGTTLVLGGRFAPDALLNAIERHRATYVTGSPAMWHALVEVPGTERRDLTSVRVISSGAGPIDPATLDALQRVFPSAVVAEGYGLTEATCLVSANPVLRGYAGTPGSVGVPLFDTDVEIRATGEPGEVLEPRQVGELWVRGPQVAAGYLGDPAATAEQFVDGWLRTGDLGYFDEDGLLFLVGRAKEMLIYNGYNVYPRELEELLSRHPGVVAAAVVGRRDSRAGQVPVAFVVPAQGARLDPGEVMAFVAEQVVPYKKVRAIHLIDQLPTSPAGKILKVELTRMANHNPAPPPDIDAAAPGVGYSV